MIKPGRVVGGGGFVVVVIIVVVVLAVVEDFGVDSLGRGTLFLDFELGKRAGTLGFGRGFLTGLTLFSNLWAKRESKSFNWTKSLSDDAWGWVLTLWIFWAGALNLGAAKEGILFWESEEVLNSNGSNRSEENDLSWAWPSENVTQNASFCKKREL